MAYDLRVQIFVNGNDPFKDVIRTTTQDYLNGQQTNTITNLTNQTINDAKQAQQAQQGGSSGSGSGSGGGNPTSQGVFIVNDTPNVVDRLYYLQRVVKDFKTNYHNSLIYLINTNPILQSIQKDGRNSPFIQVLLVSNPAIGSLVDGLQKDMNELLHFQEMVANGASPEELKEFLLQKVSDISDAIGYLDSLYKMTIDPNGGIPDEISLALAFLDVQVKQELVDLAENEFNTKYPNAYHDAWSAMTPIQGFVGYNELGIYIPASAYQDQVEARNHDVEMLVRANNPDLYDKMNLRKFDLESSKAARKLSIASYVLGKIPYKVASLAGTYLGIATPWLIQGLSALKKANYLDLMHDDEQSYLQTYLEQLFGQEYGSFKSLFKGNETPSSSRSVVEPSSNTSLKQLKASGLLFNAVATTPSLVFNGSAGNDTLFNVEDNYLISAGEGDDQISNVGDRVTIDGGVGNGNDYVANLGDNVLINADNVLVTGGNGNNVIDNAGSNVTINVNSGNNYISNGGNYVNITAGDGSNYVDNVGNSTGIWLGNGANDVENFGSNVTVNTGGGVDFIINYADYTTVNSGSGRDVVFNSHGSNVLINTDLDDDYVSVKEGSDRVTVNAGNGSDVVINNGTNSFINLGADNDFVYNDSLGSGTTITGLDGNDSLENRAANVSINGGSGDNRILNDGIAVTMVGGDGADTIANEGNAAVINAGNGNNSIGNAGDTVSIFAGSGTDSILNEGYKVTINVAGGSNQVTNKGSETSIIVGSGSNTVQNYGEVTNIKGSVDSDFIMNGATETTIDGGSGADTVLNYLAVKVGDDGNATDFHFNSNNVSIQGGLGDDYIENMGAFGTIEGGVGNDTIKNFGVLLVDQNGSIIRISPVSNYYYQIDAGEGDNFIYNENENATITSGTGADLIENVSNNVNINAGNGSNTIANIGSTVEILSGSGNDSIETDAANVTISAGAGNDFIHNYSNGSNTSINAGTGNDTISLEAGAQSNVITYKLGDGNKVIYSYNSTTTIKIIGSDFNTTQSGNDIIVKVSEGTITLKYVSNISDLNILVEDNIVGSEEADTINNRLNSAIVSALGGEDHIKNNGANVSINGGADNDSIENTAYGEYSYTTRTWSNVGTPNDVTINGGAGNDSITNYGGKRVKIDGKDDDDYIVNGKKPCDPPISETYELEAPPTLDLTPDTNKSNSSNLLETQSPVKNNGMENANLSNISDSTPEIVYSPDNATINGGLGNDTIHNEGTQALINGNEGNDYIGNTGEFVTINGGTGDDTIHNEGFYAQNNGNNTSISGGAGNDSLYNKEANNVTINAGKGNDSITNIASLVSINAGDNSDYISNSLIYGYSSERRAFTISPDNTTIDAGDGNDTISNHGDNVLINGGSGNDSISNTIYLEWNGTFIASPDDVTIDAGKGDDTIINEGNNALFIYSGGNDSIVGFNETSTLQVGDGDGSYSSQTSGDDVIVTVGENIVTLKGASSLSNINVLGNEKISWSLNGAVASYGNLFTLSNIKNVDSVEVDTSNKIVTLTADNLTGKNVSISGDYSLALSGVAPSSSKPAHFDGLIYKSVSNSEGYALSDDKKSVTYSPAVAESDLFSISGVTSADGFDVIKNGSTCLVKISDAALNSATGSTISLDKKNSNAKFIFADDFSGKKEKTVEQAAGLANGKYSSESYFKWVDLNENTLTIHPATSAKTFSLSGLNSTIKLGENVIVADGDLTAFKFKATALDKKSIVITSDHVFSVELDDDVEQNPETIPESITLKNGILNYTSAGKGDYYSTTNSGVYYIPQTKRDTFSLSGLKKSLQATNNKIDGVNISDKTITVDESALDMSATTPYSLNLSGDNFSLNLTANKDNSKIPATLSVDNGVHVYSSEYTPAHFTGNGKTYTFMPATTTATFIIRGLGNSAKLGENVTVDGNTVKIKSGALSATHEAINVDDNNFTVELEQDVAKVKKVKFATENGKVTLSGTTAGYKFVNGSYEWQNQFGGEELTIKGLKSGATLTENMFTRSGNVIIFKPTQELLPENLADQMTISITGGVIDTSSLMKTNAEPAQWKGATRFSAKTASSWTSGVATVTYTAATGGDELFTVSGLNATPNDSNVSVGTNKVTILDASLLKDGSTISATNGFTVELAGNIPTSSTKTAGSFTKFKSGTATFKTSSFSDFYSLKNNQVTYTAPSGGKTITIKNLKSSTTLDAVKSGITITEQKNGSCKITFKNADVLTSKAPTISATDVTYTVTLDKSLKPSAIAPDWKVSGTNASLKSDTSAGYTVSDNKVLYSKKVTGSPQLVLGGLVKNSSLSAPVKKVVTLDSKILGSNASLKSNAGSYTVKLTGNMSKKTFTGSANADTLNIAANNAAVLGGAGNDSFTVSGSKVTLTGGKGNDSFKLSGKNPMLIYNTGDGNDTVNFVAGMQISLSGDTQIKTLGKSGSDLLLGFSKNSSVKVTGAKSSDTIKVFDASGAVTLVAGKFDLANSLTFNSKNSSVTVAKNFSGSLAPSDDIYLGGSKLSKVATINAGNVTSEISISGNAKANFISAGKNNDSILGGNGNDSIAGNAGNDKLFGQNGNDSLSGGKGNDSLWGGDGNDTLTGNDGNDIFIYESGKDFITDYTAGQDKIQIASGKISKTSLSGSDVLFTIGKGSLTVKNAKGKTISLLDSTGKASSTVVGAQALTNSNKANVTIGADMGFVDASKRTKAILITGNALANSISGGTKNDSIFGAAGNDSIIGNDGNDQLYGDAGNDILLGGKGNDSLWGGIGNDSLWGDAGNDTFIYTVNEGTDKIFDYEAGDILKILNADGSYGSFKSSKYSGGDLTLTINGGGKIIFDDVASTTKFNINGLSYNISGSKLVKK